MIETHTGRMITFKMASLAVQNGNGLIFLAVTKGVARSGQLGLVYGFFFEDAQGTVWDVITNRPDQHQRKTIASADTALAELQKIYPASSGFSLPYLTAANCLTGLDEEAVKRAGRWVLAVERSS